MSVHLEEVGVSRRFATVPGDAPEPALSRRLGASRWAPPAAAAADSGHGGPSDAADAPSDGAGAE